MAQWRGIARGGTYPRCTDVSKPCRQVKLKKVRTRVSGGGRVGRGGKDREKDFLEPRVRLFNRTPHLGNRLTFLEFWFAHSLGGQTAYFRKSLRVPSGTRMMGWMYAAVRIKGSLTLADTPDR